MTEHVILRGHYQTAPITLFGFSLAQAAKPYTPPPKTPPLSLEDASARFESTVAALPNSSPPSPPTSSSSSSAFSYSDDAEPALHALLEYWRKVGSSPRKIAASPPPLDVFEAAEKAADEICKKLAAGESSFFPLLHSPDASDADKNAVTTSEEHELIDMAMRWCAFLAEIQSPWPTSTALLDCGAAGLAATVLLCTRRSLVSAFISRYGHLILADALKAGAAPGSQLRRAAAACLLLAQGGGALGCEALLGWWSPSFVQWAVKTDVKVMNTRGGGGDGRSPSLVKLNSHSSKKQERGGKGEDATGKSSRHRRRIPQVDGAADDGGDDGNGDRQQRHRRGREQKNSKNRDGDGGRPGSGRDRKGRGDDRIVDRLGNANSTGGGRNNRQHQQQHRFQRDGHRQQSPPPLRSIAQRRGVDDDDRWDGGGGRDDVVMLQEEQDDGGYKQHGRHDDTRGKEEEKRSKRSRRRSRSIDGDREQQQQEEGRNQKRRTDRKAGPSSRVAAAVAAAAAAAAASSRRVVRDGSLAVDGAGGVRGGRSSSKEEQGDLRHHHHRDNEPSKPVETQKQHRSPIPALPPHRPPPPAAPPAPAAAPSPPPVAPPVSKEDREDAEQLHQFTLYWDDRLTTYNGIYAPLAAILTDIQPQVTASISARLLRLLRFYEHTATFVTTAEDLTQQYLPSNRSPVPSKDAAAAAARCGTALAALAEYLSASAYEKQLFHHTGNRKCSFENEEAVSRAPLLPEVSPLLIELLQSRQVFAILPALLLIPTTHKMRGLEDGEEPAAVVTAAAAAMSNQLSLGLKPFFSALTSSLTGVKALVAASGVVPELLRVLRLPAALDPALATAVAPLRTLVLAVVAVDDLSTFPLTSAPFAAAATTLSALLSSGAPSQRLPALHAVCMSAEKVLPRCVEAIIARVTVLQAAIGIINPPEQGVASATMRQAGGDTPYEFEEGGAAAAAAASLDAADLPPDAKGSSNSGDAFNDVLDALPYLDIGSKILLALTKESSSIDILCSVAPRAAALLPQLSEAAQLLCGNPAPGATAVFTGLEIISGGLEALVAAQNGGVASVLAGLRVDVPPLLRDRHFAGQSHNRREEEEEENEGEKDGEQEGEEKNRDSKVKKEKKDNIDGDDDDDNDSSSNSTIIIVDWGDIREFWDDPRRRGRLETALRLITSSLWDPLVGRTTAAHMQYHDGQRLVLRTVTTAAEILAAAQSDRQWMSRTGAAIDPGASASNKHCALEFMSAVAAMTSAFCQHSRYAVPMKSTACAAAILEAHALLCADDESLLCLMGQSNTSTSSSSTTPTAASTAAASVHALTARHHFTAALRCWLESPNWSPSLLPLILFGPQQHRFNIRMESSESAAGAAVRALPPKQMFAAMCLLGDLAPEEWPPSGRRASNPPPSSRAYRVALTHAIDQHKAPFESLISASVMAASTLFRAASVRLLARAAGCAGGMGAFVIAPIVAALEAGVASVTPSIDLRIVLEVMVPLVYRPALKAAFLDSTAPAVLAQVLRTFLYICVKLFFFFLSIILVIKKLTIIFIIAGVMATGIPAGAPPGTSPTPIDPTDASSICTMAVECLMILCNQDQKLDPMAPPELSAIQDVPAVQSSTIIATILLEILSTLGVNVPLAQRILRLLTGTFPGRAALRRAATIVHASASGEPAPVDASVAQIAVAAQWVATRYWGLSQQAKQAGASGADSFVDVADIMKEICVSLDVDGLAPPPAPPPVAVRFTAAAQAAIEAATAAELAENEARWDRGEDSVVRFQDAVAVVGVPGGGGGVETGAAANLSLGICDAVTRMYWRNYRARMVQQTQLATDLILKKYTRRACLPDEGLTITSVLHPPLTHPLRPLVEEMEEWGVAVGEEEERNIDDDDEAVVIVSDILPLPLPPPSSSLALPFGGGGGGDVLNLKIEHVAGDGGLLPRDISVVGGAPAADDFDLYADLGGDDFGMGTDVGGSAAVVREKAVKVEVPASAAAVEKEEDEDDERRTQPMDDDDDLEIELKEMEPEPPQQQQQQQEEETKEVKVVVAPLPSPPTATPLQMPSSSSLDSGSMSVPDPATLLSNPAAVAALLKDPAKMQELLLKHPALFAVLKVKLGGGGGK